MKTQILLTTAALMLSGVMMADVTPVIQELTVCKNEQITLSSSESGADNYLWTDGVASGRSYVFQSDAVGEFHFSVTALQSDIILAHNLMANGGFEEGYKGFSSDFDAVKSAGQPVDDPNNFLNYTGGDYGHYYALTSNAQRFNPIFYPIKPHSGNRFLIVDATNAGYAWKAVTSASENPDLKLEAGKEYTFSYWAAFPNKGNELQYPSAVLQFEIQYMDGSANMVTEPLGTPFSVKDESDLYSWHKQEVRWTAPIASSYVVIGVKNLTTSANGNDFCLDDIMFQPVDASSEVVLAKDSFVVTVEECLCTPVYRMWDDVLFVDNYDSIYVSYQWYCDDAVIEGATLQYYHETNLRAAARYYCVMRDKDGHETTSCESTMADAEPSNLHPNGAHGVKQVVARRTCQWGANLQIEERIYEDGTVEVTKSIKW